MIIYNAEQKFRNAYLDNVKVVLLFLVVFAHILERFLEVKLYNSLYVIIYSFHMPLFIFISGYLSKNTDRCRQNAFSDFFIPYIIFNTIYSIFINKSIIVSIFNPVYIYWYMLCMFFWKLIIKDFVKIKYYILVSLLLSLYCGIFDNINWFLGISRTIFFFPYFLLGYWCNNTTLDKLKSIPKYFTLITFILLSIVIAYMFNTNLISDLSLFGNDCYSNLGLSIPKGILYRMIQYIISTIMGICLLNLIPNNKSKYTCYGEKTITIYLLHAYIVDFIARIHILKNINSYLGIVIFFSIAVASIFILGNNKIFKLYLRFMNLIKNIIFREKSEEVLNDITDRKIGVKL